jgi:uncharacterized protein YdgA (DUF945 family)
MKKLIPIIVLVLVAAYPAAAWIVGKQVETKFSDYHAQTAAQLPYLKVLKRDYQRGFYNSTETVTYEVMGDFMRSIAEMQKKSNNEAAINAGSDASAAEVKPITFTVRNRISHGPWAGGGVAAAKIDSEFVFSDETQKELAKLFGDKKPIEAHTVVNFGGGGTSTVVSPAFNADIPAGKDSDHGPTKLSWQGLNLKIDFAKEMQSFTAQGSAPSLSLSDSKGGNMVLTDLKYQADQKRIFADEPMLYAGKQWLSAAEMTVVSKGEAPKSVQLKGLSYEGLVASSGEFMDAGAKMSAAEFKLEDKSYGPAHYDLSFKHLHARTVAKFYRAMMKMYGDGSLLKGEKVDTGAIMQPLMEHGTELLKHNPELSLDRISFKTPDGEANLAARAKLVGATPEDFQNPMALIPKLEAAADIAMPEALAATLSGAKADTPEQAQARAGALQQQIATMEQQGLVTRSDKVLKSKIAFKAGQLTVNGKPFNPLAGAGGGAPQMDQQMPEELEQPEQKQ